MGYCSVRHVIATIVALDFVLMTASICSGQISGRLGGGLELRRAELPPPHRQPHPALAAFSDVAVADALTVTDRQHRLYQLLRIAEAQLFHDARDRARQTLDVFRQVSESPGDPVDCDKLRTLARIQARLGDQEAAAATRLRMRDVALASPPGTERDLVLHQVVDALGAAGDIDLARETCAQITEGERRDRSMGLITHFEARRGKYDDSMKTAESITNQNRRDSAFVWIVREMAEAGDVAGAQRLLAEKLPPNCPEFGHAATGIVLAQAKAGDLAGARATTDRIDKSTGRHWIFARNILVEWHLRAKDLRSARAVVAELDAAGPSAPPWGSAQLMLAVAEVRVGEPAEGEQRLDRLAQTSSLKDGVYVTAAGALAQSGHLDVAMRINRKITTPALRLRNLKVFIDAQRRAGRVDDANVSLALLRQIMPRMKPHDRAMMHLDLNEVEEAGAVARSVSDVRKRVDLYIEMISITAPPEKEDA